MSVQKRRALVRGVLDCDSSVGALRWAMTVDRRSCFFRCYLPARIPIARESHRAIAPGLSRTSVLRDILQRVRERPRGPRSRKMKEQQQQRSRSGTQMAVRYGPYFVFFLLPIDNDPNGSYAGARPHTKTRRGLLKRVPIDSSPQPVFHAHALSITLLLLLRVWLEVFKH